jgi:hypothetical protein
MALTPQQLLYQMAEDTAWSFKGHMKTADGYGFTLACLIVVPLVTSLLVLIFDLPVFLQRIAAAMGFLFSSLALTSTLATNREKADQTISAHMELGNKYLDLHKEIKVLATDITTIDQEKLIGLQKKVGELDAQTSKLRITLIGRWWSWWKINKEMDLTWIKDY